MISRKQFFGTDNVGYQLLAYGEVTKKLCFGKEREEASLQLFSITLEDGSDEKHCTLYD